MIKIIEEYDKFETKRKKLEKELGLKTILMGFGLDSDAIHSPNEHYGLFNFYKGIETIPYFFKNFSQQ
jgi:acetylornithine deacetylase/succinyl-diaminopimelate desuccinylase-like protein